MNKKIMIPLLRVLAIFHILSRFYIYLKNKFTLEIIFENEEKISLVIAIIFAAIIIASFILYNIPQAIYELNKKDIESNFLRINSILWSSTLLLGLTFRVLQIISNHQYNLDLLYTIILATIIIILIYTDLRIQLKQMNR
ncbi:MAG: heme/copper-type cytochrome/quinol oxidase subunit 3 [Flavobacteriaceae bacterium]|jgi:heme/copper-type cytochrome/quinol oxidase subunit 3